MKLQKKEKRYTEENESHPELKQREKFITKLQRLKTKLNSKSLKQLFQEENSKTKNSLKKTFNHYLKYLQENNNNCN